MQIIDIKKEAIERTGKNWVGNIYKYRWTVFIKDDRKEPYGLQQRVNGIDVNIKRAFTGKKLEVKKWLKKQKLEWNWEKDRVNPN